MKLWQTWLPQTSLQVWLLAWGRLLLQIGSGFTLFYAPIFFVNQVGLSPTVVGWGLGMGSMAGVLGRFWGGTWADSPQGGRKPVLLLSAVISALADGTLALAGDFPIFLVGNLLMGLGIGLYWPATEAAIADLTPPEQRHEIFAMARLADSLGLGLGVILGGLLISTTGAYRALFVIDGMSFLVFFAVIYWAIAETRHDRVSSHSALQGWKTALGDRSLWIFVSVNILFTTYLAQVNSTLPVYFSHFVGSAIGSQPGSQPDSQGLNSQLLSLLFSWHVVLAALCQMPIARYLKRFRAPQALMISALFWGIGFGVVGLTGLLSTATPFWAVLALSLLSIAMVAYTPAASALVVELAPAHLLGVYLSINSQCWAIGYFVGPPLGGYALEGSGGLVHGFWFLLWLSTGLGIGILQVLDRRLRTRTA